MSCALVGRIKKTYKTTELQLELCAYQMQSTFGAVVLCEATLCNLLSFMTLTAEIKEFRRDEFKLLQQISHTNIYLVL